MSASDDRKPSKDDKSGKNVRGITFDVTPVDKLKYKYVAQQFFSD